LILPPLALLPSGGFLFYDPFPTFVGEEVFFLTVVILDATI
jgi:hypothetical protein